jgi:hypothetical protein
MGLRQGGKKIEHGEIAARAIRETGGKTSTQWAGAHQQSVFDLMKDYGAQRIGVTSRTLYIDNAIPPTQAQLVRLKNLASGRKIMLDTTDLVDGQVKTVQSKTFDNAEAFLNYFKPQQPTFIKTELKDIPKGMTPLNKIFSNELARLINKEVGLKDELSNTADDVFPKLQKWFAPFGVKVKSFANADDIAEFLQKRYFTNVHTSYLKELAKDAIQNTLEKMGAKRQ